MKKIFLGLALLLGAASTPAFAADEALEVWLTQTVSYHLDSNTTARIETTERFRNANDGRPDTYFVQGWLGQQIDNNNLVEVGIEKRVTAPGADEIRVHQQVSTRLGLLRNRLRVEQRFVDNSGQTGWRVRVRPGVQVPLDKEHKWSLRGDAEFFLTLKPTRAGGQTGLTEQRIQLILIRRVNDHTNFSFGYTRSQTIRKSNQDVVGHIPTFAFEYNF